MKRALVVYIYAEKHNNRARIEGAEKPNVSQHASQTAAVGRARGLAGIPAEFCGGYSEK